MKSAQNSGNLARNLLQSKKTSATLGREVTSFIMSANLMSIFKNVYRKDTCFICILNLFMIREHSIIT